MGANPATAALAFTDEGTGPCAVLLHGLTFNRTSWRPIIDRARAQIRCVAVDLPGHGGSTGPMTVWAIPRLIQALLAELDIDRAVVVGHSLGAAVAMCYAAQYPAEGVLTVDQGVDVTSVAPLARAVAPTLDGPGFEQAWELARQAIGRDKVPEPFRSELIAQDEARPDVVRSYWTELIADPAGVQQKVDDLAARVTAPVLAVFGHALGDAERADFRRALPAAEVEFEEWPDAGHCVHLVHPDRFAGRLVDFTRRCHLGGR